MEIGGMFPPSSYISYTWIPAPHNHLAFPTRDPQEKEPHWPSSSLTDPFTLFISVQSFTAEHIKSHLSGYGSPPLVSIPEPVSCGRKRRKQKAEVSWYLGPVPRERAMGGEPSHCPGFHMAQFLQAHGPPPLAPNSAYGWPTHLPCTTSSQPSWHLSPGPLVTGTLLRCGLFLTLLGFRNQFSYHLLIVTKESGQVPIIHQRPCQPTQLSSPWSL